VSSNGKANPPIGESDQAVAHLINKNFGLGMVLLAAAVAHHHLPVFLAAMAISGAGYSLLFFGGLQTINSAAPAEHRGGVLSAIYLLAYVSLGAVSLLLGAVATAHGLSFAVNLGAGVISLFSVITVALVAMTRAGSIQIAIPSKSEGQHMIRTTPEQNKALVLEAFDTLFNKRDYDAASRFWPTSTFSTALTSNPVAKGCSGLSAAFPTACATSTISSSQKATTSSSTAAFRVTDNPRHGWPPTW
jgi:hypothetical protein